MIKTEINIRVAAEGHDYRTWYSKVFELPYALREGDSLWNVIDCEADEWTVRDANFHVANCILHINLDSYLDATDEGMDYWHKRLLENGWQHSPD